MLGSSNNWKTINFTNKTTPSEEFNEMHQVVIYGISENMASLVKTGKYGAINAEDTTTLGCYVVKYLSKPYKLQEDNTTDGKVIKAGYLSVKA